MLELVVCVFVLMIAAPVVLAAVVSAYLHTIGPIVCEGVANIATDSFNRMRDAIQSLFPSQQPESVIDGEAS
jgi:hypothetical protein